MTGMGDEFKVSEDVLAQQESEIIHNKMSELVEDIEGKKVRLLAHAFVAGYDGVDIRMEPNTDWKRSPSQFNISYDYEAWEGKPPEVGVAPSGLHRYDFRSMDKYEKRELVAHIGLTEVPEDV